MRYWMCWLQKIGTITKAVIVSDDRLTRATMLQLLSELRLLIFPVTFLQSVLYLSTLSKTHFFK